MNRLCEQKTYSWRVSSRRWHAAFILRAPSQAIATWDLPPRGWAWTVLLSLLQTWLVIDPLFILVRNNASCTRTRVRTVKYQVIEKAGAKGPLRLIANLMAEAFAG